MTNRAHVLDEEPLDFSRTRNIALLLLPYPRRSKGKENPGRPEHLLFPSLRSSAQTLVPSTQRILLLQSCPRVHIRTNDPPEGRLLWAPKHPRLRQVPTGTKEPRELLTCCAIALMGPVCANKRTAWPTADSGHPQPRRGQLWALQGWFKTSRTR